MGCMGAEDPSTTRNRSSPARCAVMSSQMRLAIAIPQAFADGAFEPAGLRAYLARAEALGFDSAWTSEAIFGRMPFLDAVDILSYAAAITERMRLGCAVMLPTLRS